MTADVIQIRDFQLKRDIERAEAALNRDAIEIANIALFNGFGVVRPTKYIDPSQANASHAPESDPA